MRCTFHVLRVLADRASSPVHFFRVFTTTDAAVSLLYLAGSLCVTRYASVIAWCDGAVRCVGDGGT